MHILKLKQQHENIGDKDFACAFIHVYKTMNLMLSSRFFKEDISDSLIMEAITAVYLDMEDNNQKLHFLISLVYKSEVKKNGVHYTLISSSGLRDFTLFEILKLAVAVVNNVREDDGFLAFIKDATVKKYESMEEVIKEIYNSDQNEFKKILLKLAIKTDTDDKGKHTDT